MNTRTRTLTTAAALLLASTALLTGCSALGDVIDVAQPIIEAVDDESTWIEVGDCFNETSGDVVSDIPTVPCTDAHDYEVYAEFDIDLAVFPGDDEVFRLADEGCLAPFASYVGLDFASSALDYTSYVPTEDGWNGYDDRAVSCVLFDPAGELTGSMAGAAR
jgi:hypothetical protein